jgi:tryptophan 2,3-dioxygenase
MLNAERKEDTGSEAGAVQLPLSYGSYLRVPELLSLQTPLGPADARDEMLFIVSQQVQELWFKLILHDMRFAIDSMLAGQLLEALPLLQRVNQTMRLLGDEVAILETMPPQEFHKFRGVLSAASGFESVQFRELELASGLREQTFLKLIEKHMDVEELWLRWPQSLHDAFLAALSPLSSDPVEAVMLVYREAAQHGALFLVAEALSEYEVLFNGWRYHHVKLVERTIGDRAIGTAGSSGAGYLGKTLGYRFFPELWEARNRLTEAASS